MYDVENPAESREYYEIFVRKDARSGQEAFFVSSHFGREGKAGTKGEGRLVRLSSHLKNGNKHALGTRLVTKDVGKSLEDFAASVGRDVFGRLLLQEKRADKLGSRTPDRNSRHSCIADSPSDVSTTSTVIAGASPWDGSVERPNDLINKKLLHSLDGLCVQGQVLGIAAESSNQSTDPDRNMRMWRVKLEEESSNTPALLSDAQVAAGIQKWEKEQQSKSDASADGKVGEWRRSGSKYIGRYILRSLMDDAGRAIGKVRGRVVAWLPATESDYISEATGKAEPLWHVELEDDAGEEDLEPFELHEALDLYEAHKEGALCHGEGEIVREYTTQGPSSIMMAASFLSVDARALWLINSLRFPGMRKNSKLQTGTGLLVPPPGVTDEDELLRLAKEHLGDDQSNTSSCNSAKSTVKKSIKATGKAGSSGGGKGTLCAPKSQASSKMDEDDDSDSDAGESFKSPKFVNSAEKSKSGGSAKAKSASNSKTQNDAVKKSGSKSGKGTKVKHDEVTPPPESPRPKKQRKSKNASSPSPPRSGRSLMSPSSQSAPQRPATECRFPDYPLMTEADFPAAWSNTRDRMFKSFICPYQRVDGIIYGVPGYEAIAPTLGNVDDKWAVSYHTRRNIVTSIITSCPSHSPCVLMACLSVCHVRKTMQILLVRLTMRCSCSSHVRSICKKS